MKKGTYVLRSTYQKLFEENKKLKEDIRILTEEEVPSIDKIFTLRKWRTHFKRNAIIQQELKEFFTEIYKEHKRKKEIK